MDASQKTGAIQFFKAAHHDWPVARRDPAAFCPRRTLSRGHRGSPACPCQGPASILSASTGFAGRELRRAARDSPAPRRSPASPPRSRWPRLRPGTAPSMIPVVDRGRRSVEARLRRRARSDVGRSGTGLLLRRAAVIDLPVIDPCPRSGRAEPSRARHATEFMLAAACDGHGHDRDRPARDIGRPGTVSAAASDPDHGAAHRAEPFRPVSETETAGPADGPGSTVQEADLSAAAGTPNPNAAGSHGRLSARQRAGGGLVGAVHAAARAPHALCTTARGAPRASPRVLGGPAGEKLALPGLRVRCIRGRERGSASRQGGVKFSQSALQSR